MNASKILKLVGLFVLVILFGLFVLYVVDIKTSGVPEEAETTLDSLLADTTHTDTLFLND